MRSLILSLAGLAVLIAAAPDVHAEPMRIDANGRHVASVAVGTYARASTTTGVVESSTVRRADVQATSHRAAAIAIGTASAASINVGGITRGARVNSARTRASARDTYALSVAPGAARASIGAVCRVAGGSVSTNAHTRGVVALNAGVWTPIPRRVNIGSVGRC